MKLDESKEAENHEMPPKEAKRRYVAAGKAFLEATIGLPVKGGLEEYPPNIRPRIVWQKLRESVEAVADILAKSEDPGHSDGSDRDGSQEGRDDAHPRSSG